MATAKEREEFLTLLAREYPDKGLMHVCDFGRVLMRLARTHGQLACDYCNGPQHLDYTIPAGEDCARLNAERRAAHTAWDAALERKRESNARRISEVCTEFGIIWRHSGDPRGYTVKVHLPSGKGNTWGGDAEGWGVPQ